METETELTRMRRMRERIANVIYGIGEWICRRADRVLGITYPSSRMEPPKTREPIELANCCHIPIVISGSGMYLSESARDVDLMCKACGQVWNVQFKAGSDVAKIEPIYKVDKIIVRSDDEEMVPTEDLIKHLAKTEQMSTHAHKVWARWAEYMLDNLTPENTEKWRNQIATPYSELSEEDKEKDRAIYYGWMAEYTKYLRPDTQGEEDIGREGKDNNTQETNQATKS
jgi:hypothetical protein